MTEDPKIPNSIALDRLKSKGIMPTSLSSAELRKLDRDVLDRSIFSARTSHADYVQAVYDGISELLQGAKNEATVRAGLQDMLDSLGYRPEMGFAGDMERGIPPAEAGTLRDLSSNKRVKLVLETNQRQVANFAYWKSGQDDLERYQFPAWELVRIYPRVKERQDWAERWVTAGGTLVGDGRMIALKDDAVWDQLGSSELFDDGLDTPYPPYAFGSGMGLREVEREECIALGLITGDEVPEMQDQGLNDELQAAADRFSPEILHQLSSEFEITAGEIRLKAA
jgi:hypothetical protein